MQFNVDIDGICKDVLYITMACVVQSDFFKECQTFITKPVLFIKTRYRRFIKEVWNINYVHHSICFRKSVFYAPLENQLWAYHNPDEWRITCLKWCNLKIYYQKWIFTHLIYIVGTKEQIIPCHLPCLAIQDSVKRTGSGEQLAFPPWFTQYLGSAENTLHGPSVAPWLGKQWSHGPKNVKSVLQIYCFRCVNFYI